MKLLTDKTAGELVRHLKAAVVDPTRRTRIAHGTIPSPPRPFACRLAADTADGAGEGTKALFCYLPPETAEAVRFRGAVVATGQVLGTAEKPWVRVADGDATALYLCLSFSFGSDGDATATGWTLSTSIPDAPAGGALWPHLVWARETGIGAVQYHLGSLSLGDPAASGDESEETPDDCTVADDERFPSRVDELGTEDRDGDGTDDGDPDEASFPSVSGDSGGGETDPSVLPAETDDPRFPSKVDTCW